ncbi:antitoxin [Brevibacterium atlanticum]|uniref:antitoxin n=1 Tax=Brevibacterium atlanticum TaxID=2697563 RepID=UPI0014214AC8|nr:antitoxin [Brevibacterium atlanticum]
MAFDKFLDKAKNLANDPKVKDKLNSDKAEQVSDSILDKAAGVAESLTGGKHSEKIQKARDAADKAIGNERGQDADRTDGRNDGERGRTDDPRNGSESSRGDDSPDSRSNG